MPALPSTHKKRAFYHQTFVIKDKDKEVYRHTLLVNPQDMSITEPARINVQQTLGGAYVSKFGQGLHQITLSVLTGYNARPNAEGKMTDGYEELKNFRDKVYRYYVTAPSSHVEMFWYNWEDEQYYKVVPMSFRVMRNVAQPTMYRYELSMTALEPVGPGRRPRPTPNKLNKVTMPEVGSAIGNAILGITKTLSSIRKGGR